MAAPAPANPADPDPSGVCHLLRLPAELRNEIYRLVIETSRPRHAYDLGHLPIRPALVSVNRQIRIESMPIYFINIDKVHQEARWAVEETLLQLDEATSKADYLVKHREYKKALDGAVRASNWWRTEGRRLWRMGWPVVKWIDAYVRGLRRAAGLPNEEDA